MTAGILNMQCKFCYVFIGHKNSYKSLQLTVYMGNLFATSKWNGHNIVHKNYFYYDFSVFLWLFTICLQWWICELFMTKTIYNTQYYSFANQGKWHYIKEFDWWQYFLLRDSRWYFTLIFRKAVSFNWFILSSQYITFHINSS